MKTIAEIRARLAAISASLDGIVAGDTGYTEEQQTEVETLNAEFEALNKQLETAEKMEAMKAKATASAGRKTESGNGDTKIANVQVGRTLNEKFGGFNSSGEFLTAVKNAASGEYDKRFKNTAYEKVGEDGGFLVPSDISDSILKKLISADSLMASVTSLKVGGNSLQMNVDESQPWNQGIQCYWTAEGGTITQSKPSFKQANWRLQKLAALVTCTDELLDDAIALDSYIQNAAPNAFMHKINNAIISGNGTGKPQGILNSPFTVQVAAEGSQTVDTVNYRNVAKMYSRMFPQSRANAVWLIHPQVEEQLRTMVDDNGNFIYLSPGTYGAQINSTPFGTLLGRPVIPMMGSMSAIGDVGDILFLDLSYYYMISKASGVNAATSIHLLFDKDQTAYRFTMRVDGKAPFQAPVTTELGSYTMSAFVSLAAR